MFLLSRYIMWFDKILQKSGSWENLIMSSLVDMKCLQKLLGDKENLKSPQNIYAIFPEKMEAVIVKVFESNRQILSQFSMNLNNHLIASKVRECSEQLQNVTAIPRLFRRTNRKPPKKASTYMIEAIKPIIDLHEKYKNADSDIMEPLLNNIIPRVTNSYSTLVHDVLQSVCKTEESLRRLKSRNIPSNDDTQCPSSEIVTDEMKIREQIKLDINYFTNMLRKIGAPNSNEALTKLGEHLS
ncbi:hypothetical protein HHI36_023735 [Cryptolaemus montrouzieri]|uniref:COG complex component COG2 C-terminal domain-containing protein n=1 Tax=Cryptolaemus montrouzieri TaxID=559131 RepID=A0ABD2PHX3_9CUCU